jgi:hypothetical protein
MRYGIGEPSARYHIKQNSKRFLSLLQWQRGTEWAKPVKEEAEGRD